MYFPVSGVEVFPLWPAAGAFAVSLCCSTAGISGAFLLLPYQVSVLGYAQPGVSATNQIFNILACPAGVWRYGQEGRLLAPLALLLTAGTLPGVFIGAVLRVALLSSQHAFMMFAACVLLYLGWRLLAKKGKAGRAAGGVGKCQVLAASRAGFRFACQGQVYSVKALPLLALSFIVGIVGGAYGIGGGAIIVPFLTTVFGLPIHAIAGAALLATFLTSLAGVAFYSFLAAVWRYPGAAPDWMLGLMLGAGGMAGMYCGAALQKYLPAQALRILIAVIILLLFIHYLIRALAL
ncbi:MAG: sulfite exporter TauE/SafE family protein [Desulfovibrio sp.]|nr:sulfite exporter TauE/SafE family protein [Desulfovibrio sp.]